MTKTNAPAVLVETEYHDNSTGADWIRSHIEEIAANLTKGLTIYFGLPFIETVGKPRCAVVTTQESPLNLRERPSLEAAVLARIPKGACVTVYSTWKEWSVVGYQDYLGYAASAYLT